MASIKLAGDTSGEITISAPAVAGTTTLELPATSSTLATQNALGVRNLIINGDMRIAQRGTSVTGLTGNSYPTADRWQTILNAVGTWTATQDSSVPSGQGFSNSFKLACTTANASLNAGSVFQFQQRIEGQLLQHLKFGTSSAESLTLSFWVKSNKTGTYVAELRHVDGNFNYGKTYTIDTADTWEKKTLTFEGETTAAFDNDNNQSLQFNLWLAGGTTYTSGTQNTTWDSTAANRMADQTVNLADSTSNYINITGVQLEISDGQATPFEHRPYDMELARCFRYYWQGVSIMNSYATTGCVGQPYKVRMRANPTITWSYGGTANRVYRISDAVQTTLTGPSTPTTTDQLYYIYSTVSSWAASSGTSHNGIITDLVLSAEL